MCEIIEVHIIADIPFSILQSTIAAGKSPVDFSRQSLRTHCNALASIIECGYADIVGAFFIIGKNYAAAVSPQFISYSHIPAETVVDIRHHRSEKIAVRRAVFQAFESYIEMNHLMDYHILPLTLRQIEQYAETNLEVAVLPVPRRTYFPIVQSPEKCSCTREHYRHFRQRPSETHLVETGKLFLSVWNGDYHRYWSLMYIYQQQKFKIMSAMASLQSI